MPHLVVGGHICTFSFTRSYRRGGGVIMGDIIISGTNKEGNRLKGCTHRVKGALRL